MCRLYGFHANELTKVECSLVYAQNALLMQSRADSAGLEHADGWGIACYGDLSVPENRIPGLVKHKTAAFEDATFGYEAETAYAQTVVAHVRLATVGLVGPLNAHPFTYDGWTFAHNGILPGFNTLRAELERETGHLQGCRLGTTDSEQFFLWLLQRLVHDGVDLHQPDFGLVGTSIMNGVAEIDRRCREVEPNEMPRLTFILTNGHGMLGCCWNSPLHQLRCQGIRDCEICGIPHIQCNEQSDYQAIIFASEPITQEPWERVPNESITVAHEDFQISTRRMPQGTMS